MAEMHLPTGVTALIVSATRLADRAVVCEVETEGVLVEGSARDGQCPVYDIGAMFNTNEHSPFVIDMANEAIAYGIARGLFELLPDPPIRVRLLRRPPMPFPTL